VDRLQAEVRQRPERLGAQQRVAELEQRISAAGAAGVQLSPERTEPRKGQELASARPRSLTATSVTGNLSSTNSSTR
jgi:hypothetical protein